MPNFDTTTADLALELENQRLQRELRARLADLRSCHRRLVGAIERERRRIERDLHDATQGRLVSLAMSLGFLEAMLPDDPGSKVRLRVRPGRPWPPRSRSCAS